MPNIVLSYGWQKLFPAILLKDHGATLFFVADSQSPFKIMQDTPLGPLIEVNGIPLLKDRKAAIPYLRLRQDEAGNVHPLYLTEADKMLNIDEIDLYIPDVVPQSYHLQLPFIKMLEHHGVRVLETSDAIANCMSKIKTYEALSQAGLPVPDSLPLPHTDENAREKALVFFKKHDGQIIIKKSSSSIGQDIYLPTAEDELLKALTELFRDKNDALIQEKVEIEHPLHHLHVAIAYGEVIATQKFIADPQSLTSHIKNHINVEDVNLTNEQIDICKRAVQKLGGNLCSLDCLISTDGDFYILEVNIMPSIQQWLPEQATKMTQKIIEENL